MILYRRQSTSAIQVLEDQQVPGDLDLGNCNVVCKFSQVKFVLARVMGPDGGGIANRDGTET